ncbi:hypothetical protein ACQFYA_16730 [Promicromonospora sp. Marseille-Q5078]
MTDDGRLRIARDQDRAELRRAVATGELLRLRRGAYLACDDRSAAPTHARATTSPPCTGS